MRVSKLLFYLFAVVLYLVAFAGVHKGCGCRNTAVQGQSTNKESWTRSRHSRHQHLDDKQANTHACKLNQARRPVGNAVGVQVGNGEFGMKLRRIVKHRRGRMRKHTEQETCCKLLSLPIPSRHINTPVLAINGVTVSRGINHSEAKLHSSFFYLHS